MKPTMLLIVLCASFASVPVAANYTNGGASGGQTLGPEIKCLLPNGNTQQLPPLYCEIFDGKEQ